MISVGSTVLQQQDGLISDYEIVKRTIADFLSADLVFKKTLRFTLRFPDYSNVCTCAALAVILVEFYKNRGGNHQEVSERGRGRVSHNWKPFTQTPQALRQRGEKERNLISISSRDY